MVPMTTVAFEEFGFSCDMNPLEVTLPLRLESEKKWFFIRIFGNLKCK